MRLKDILSGTSPVFVSGSKDVEVSELSMDSRRVRPGTLFFALPGAHTDGNRYVREAVEKGAVSVVSELKPPPAPMAFVRPGSPERPICWVQAADVFASMGRMAANFHGEPTGRMTVVGVTGTNGKTTTAYFLESIFSRMGGTPGMIGTVSHRLRGREIEKAANTTPFSLDLQRLAARMRAEGATHLVLEVSSHALATKRVDELHFDAAVMTNLQSDHLDFHKNRDSYFEAKARLFELLERPDTAKERRVAVLNRDDETYPRLRRRVLEVPIAGYGRSEKADYRLAWRQLRPDGCDFRFGAKGKEWAGRIRLIGGHNVLNALAAAAAAMELGAEPEKVLEGLAALDRVPGRFEPVEAGQDFAVLVDYAHTEDALSAALGSLRELPHRRILTVFGCGGDRDKSKRGPMGAAAGALSDQVFVTSDNPRGEDPMAILRQIEDGLRGGGYENYRIVPDRKEAVLEAVRAAQKGDIVLIAGKGHEQGQILKGRMVRFDDREAAREALKCAGKI